jgi:PEGA domain
LPVKPAVRATRAMLAILAAGALAAGAAPVSAQPRRPVAAPAPVRAPVPRHKVVLAPLATLGTESSSAEVRAAQKLVAGGLAAVPVDLVDHAAMLDAIRRARRPELRACDGESECLADLGQLVGADYAVYGEVGGLGLAQVIYLKLFDARARNEVRATVLELGEGTGSPEAGARAACTRLLAPDRYVGRLVLETQVRGAAIFVDGAPVAHMPARPLALAVGSHALRVTHPEFRDFVRFVEVEFDTTSRVAVDLRPYRAVAGDIHRTAMPAPPRDRAHAPTPWYRRWYTLAAGGALLLATSALLAALASPGPAFDREISRDTLPLQNRGDSR